MTLHLVCLVIIISFSWKYKSHCSFRPRATISMTVLAFLNLFSHKTFCCCNKTFPSYYKISALRNSQRLHCRAKSYRGFTSPRLEQKMTMKNIHGEVQKALVFKYLCSMKLYRLMHT